MLFAAATATLLCVTPIDAAHATDATTTTTTTTEFAVVHAADPRGVVVFLHGWSRGMTADDILPAVPETPIVHQVVAAGWTVYAPFLDSDWGTGHGAVDDVLEQVEADGYDVSTVRLLGVSAGASTALNWAWRHPERVAAVWAVTPVFDLDALHDLDTPANWSAPSITASLDDRFGPDFEDGSADFDPARNVEALKDLAGRLWVFGARDDEVIDWGKLEDWCDDIGIDVAASAGEGELGGGHIYATLSIGWMVVSEAWFGAAA